MSSDEPITIEENKNQCPVCGEKSYIGVSASGKKYCLSCGYEDKQSKMSQEFISPPT